jgi:hypothetical protein
MNSRLIHDAAFAMACALADLLDPALPEEERQDAREMFYHVCKAGLEAYELQLNRMQQRLRPTSN